jgi:hypothetical protein
LPGVVTGEFDVGCMVCAHADAEFWRTEVGAASACCSTERAAERSCSSDDGAWDGSGGVAYDGMIGITGG